MIFWVPSYTQATWVHTLSGAVPVLISVPEAVVSPIVKRMFPPMVRCIVYPFHPVAAR